MSPCSRMEEREEGSLGIIVPLLRRLDAWEEGEVIFVLLGLCAALVTPS